MTAPATNSLRIVPRPGAGGDAPPTRSQQKFNSLIKKVAQLKRSLHSWEHAMPAIHRGVAEYQRLRSDHTAALGDLVRLLDRMHADRALTARERSLLGELLCDMAADLAVTSGLDDLKAIYNKHSHGDLDAELAAEQAARAEQLKMMLEHGFGIELGADVSSLEDIQRATLEHLGEQEREAAELQAAADAYKARRKKSARQLASEARRTAETAQIGKTLQEVYRKLAILLHPDHEQDSEERARKTLLMQEVNVAYDRKDLLRLLELRLQFEQVDEATAHTIADDRLAHFNTLLAEQVRQLQQELATVEAPWRDQLDAPPGTRMSPALVQARLQDDLRGLAAAIAQVRVELTRLVDPRELKAWLRAARRVSQAAAEHDAYDAYEAADYEAAAPRARRRR